jgi:hypothetical protein
MDLASSTKTARKWLIRIVIGLVLLVAYSSGERVGFVQKMSKRGWLCHTNEGELAMVNLPGQPATVFDFTVPGDDVSKQIDALAGDKIVLTYEEHRGIPSSCFGDTGYFVTAVRKADQGGK